MIIQINCLLKNINKIRFLQLTDSFNRYEKIEKIEKGVVMKNFIVSILLFIFVLSLNNMQAIDEGSHSKTEDQGNVISLAREYIEKNDYEKAVTCLEEAARKEHTEAQEFLGILYYDGSGVKQDLSKARFWLEKAALKDRPFPQTILGVIYLDGIGVPADYDKACFWLEKAAKQQFTAAQHTLGCVYLFGKGVTKNYKKALDFFESAALQGDTYSQYQLAGMYLRGQGVPKDDIKAFQLFESASNSGCDVAQLELGVMFANGEGMKAPDYEKAAYWYEKAAEQGNPRAQYFLSRLFKEGLGVTKDEKKAFQLLQQASNNGDERAIQDLGREMFNY